MYRVRITHAADSVFAHSDYLHNAGTPIDFEDVNDAAEAAADYANDYAAPSDAVEIVSVTTPAFVTAEDFLAALTA